MITLSSLPLRMVHSNVDNVSFIVVFMVIKKKFLTYKDVQPGIILLCKTRSYDSLNPVKLKKRWQSLNETS